ncbi:MAG: hypothetical protein U1C51_01795, partial [Candidatus Izemoplasmatales bacterium]|nr:hypothetical protein [Candidatus Izemoplasmatales bacterium]
YDVLSTIWGIQTKNHYVKDIMARENRSMQIFPYIIPSTVINNIQASSKSSYRWQLNLGSFNQSIGLWSDTTLDKTTLLEMDYYYNGYFFQDQVIIDEPYDWEDIVIVNPILDPNNLLMNIASWVLANPGTAITIVVAIVVISLVAKLLGALSGILAFIGVILKGVGHVIKLGFQLIVFFLKGVGKVLFAILKLKWFLIRFIFIRIPRGIISFIYFLFTPAQLRQERKGIVYVNRSL